VVLLFFLFQVVVISLSGVMMPGPITAAAVAMGAQSQYAGALLAVGHGIIEFPLMVLIMLGAGRILKLDKTKIVIGLVGGAFLLIMAVQMLITLHVASEPQTGVISSRPILAGFMLSAGNPYFLLWWATVGLRLATDARRLGMLAFALFAIVHWLCDLGWFQILSWTSFKGTGLLGSRSQLILLIICSVALLVFGVLFIYKAGLSLVKLFIKRGRVEKIKF